MKLEQQVTSLEISKRLKELGVKQESLFYWLNPFKQQDWQLVQTGEWSLNGHHNFCSAFTVAELGDMLPSFVDETFRKYKFMSMKLEDQWNSGYYIPWEDNSYTPLVSGGCYRGCGWYIFGYADTEVEARGKVLIKLLEKKYITL